MGMGLEWEQISLPCHSLVYNELQCCLNDMYLSVDGRRESCPHTQTGGISNVVIMIYAQNTKDG